jgi:hypothetical protein
MYRAGVPLKTISPRTLFVAVGLYGLLIAGLTVLARLTASSLNPAKLQGMIHALQSMAAEQKQLGELRVTSEISHYFVSAEMAKIAQLADDLGHNAAKMKIAPRDEVARDKARALAAELTTERASD